MVHGNLFYTLNPTIVCISNYSFWSSGNFNITLTISDHVMQNLVTIDWGAWICIKSMYTCRISSLYIIQIIEINELRFSLNWKKYTNVYYLFKIVEIVVSIIKWLSVIASNRLTEIFQATGYRRVCIHVYF